LLAALACLLILVAGLLSQPRAAGGQPAQPANPREDGPTPGIYRATHCKNCHDQDQSHSYSQSERERMICRMTEWQYFDGIDRHQIAFRSLESPRGREMAKQLGYSRGQATAVDACLACHAVRAPGSQQSGAEALIEGVTCVGCHGAYADWVEIHPGSVLLTPGVGAVAAKTGRVKWSDLSRKEKERRFGMTDLWDPVRRAETCAACHVGNYAEGKVITHAMYAAGHPPLPSFEAATFGDAQPRHWQNLSEKTPEQRKRLKPPNPDNLEQTRLVVASGLVVLREWMTLSADLASATKPGPDQGRSPDFARFDCYACHHELQAPNGASWRQTRRDGGPPGRPPAPDWPLSLIPLATAAAGPTVAAARDAEFNGLLAEFIDSSQARPFGDPSRVDRAARNMAKWANTFARSLESTHFDASTARRLLDRLCELARERTLDYYSARQIAWAFRVIYHEITPKATRDPVCERILAELEAGLQLNLATAARRASIEELLPVRLRASAAFDPRSFQAQFEKIAERLKRTPPAAPATR
jgi:hypothetical protein